MRNAIAAILFAIIAAIAAPVTAAPSSCSGTVGTTAAAINLPAAPYTYISIANPSASATLWVNAVGGTAVANASGSFAIGPGGLVWWALPDMPPPMAISIIATGASTPYTCAYN
jgi:hypothetical protein